MNMLYVFLCSSRNSISQTVLGRIPAIVYESHWPVDIAAACNDGRHLSHTWCIVTHRRDRRGDMDFADADEALASDVTEALAAVVSPDSSGRLMSMYRSSWIRCRKGEGRYGCDAVSNWMKHTMFLSLGSLRLYLCSLFNECTIHVL